MASQAKKKGASRVRGAKDFADRQAELFSADFSFSGYERDFVALNLGGKRFLDISGVSGADSVTDGRGAVFADFDNDGDSDIFLRAMHGPAHRLFHNRVGQDLSFVRIALQGTRSGRDAFGAIVQVKTSAGLLTQVKNGGGGFLSQPDPRLLFGLGQDARAEWIEVLWPSGLKQRFDGPAAGTSLLLVEGRETARNVPERRFRLPDPLSPLEQRFVKLLVKPRQPLPALSILDLTNKKKPLTDLLTPGRPILLNFWATWCVSCATEMPELQKLYRGSDSDGLRIVGISVDDATARDKIPAFLERAGVTYPVCAIEPSELAKLFATPDVGIPLSILLDEKLRVVDLFQGWSMQSRLRLAELTRTTRTR